MSVLYDAGFLLAADRNDREALADHAVRLEQQTVPITTAPVVAQVSRSPLQVVLRHVLAGCREVGFDKSEAHAVGALLAASGTADVVDAHLVLVASPLNATIVTSDSDDIEHLAAYVEGDVRVRRI